MNEGTDNESTDAEDLRTHAVRLSRQADQDAEQIALSQNDAAQGQSPAGQWLTGLYLEIGRLATLPHRIAVVERETRLFGRETRRMVYRRTATSAAYSVFFFISEAGEDGPSVTVLHVRQGGRKPVTRAEARSILAESEE